MRGGAIPIFAWGTILLVLAIGNWIWDGRPVNSGAATAAVAIVYGYGVAVWLLRREAVRRGPPEPRTEVENVPSASVSAMVLGLSAGCALFGLAWANFLLYFGAAMFVAALLRLGFELRAERATRREILGEGERE